MEYGSHMATDTTHLVANAISTALHDAGMTKIFAAEATGIAYSTLGRKLKGVTDFNFTEVKLIADVLGVTPGSLIPSTYLVEPRTDSS